MVLRKASAKNTGCGRQCKSISVSRDGLRAVTALCESHGRSSRVQSAASQTGIRRAPVQPSCLSLTPFVPPSPQPSLCRRPAHGQAYKDIRVSASHFPVVTQISRACRCTRVGRLFPAKRRRRLTVLSACGASDGPRQVDVGSLSEGNGLWVGVGTSHTDSKRAPLYVKAPLHNDGDTKILCKRSAVLPHYCAQNGLFI